MGWLKRLFGGGRDEGRGQDVSGKGRAPAALPCGHTSVDQGVRAGCVQCALRFQAALAAVKRGKG
jgi:hypothetical protein